jgi:hypothetical protein
MLKINVTKDRSIPDLGSAIRACVGCKNYEPDFIDSDGDTYGDCKLDDAIIAILPANWLYCPRERCMPDAWVEGICVQWTDPMELRE